MKIGVLALQGSFKDHERVLKKLKVEIIEVKNTKDLNCINGLIIPGGESTTIGKLSFESGLDKQIAKIAKKGMPIYGTCAGAILLSKEISNSLQPRLGLLDMVVERNGYGRQLESFEANLNIKGIGDFNGIFIRAPIIKECSNAKILAKLDGNPVFIVDKNIMATTFHPELTNDSRIHKYFMHMIKKSGYNSKHD